MRQPRYADLRKVLLRHNIRQVLDLGENIFVDAVVPVVITLLKPTQSGEKASFIDLTKEINLSNVAEKFATLNFTTISQNEWERTPQNIFITDIRKIRKNEEILGNIITMKDAGINYQRVNVGLSQKTKSDLAQRLLYAGDREKASDMEYWKGEDIGSYYCANHTSRFCRTDVEVKSNEHVTLNKKYFEIAPKLIWRQTAPYCICTVDYRGVWFGRIIQAGTINDSYKNKISYEYLCALLNSKYLRHLYSQIVKEGGRVFPQVKLEKLKPLPILIADTEVQTKIKTLVNTILSKKKQNPQADTSAEENAIDKLIYQLYGLSEDEIKQIEKE